MKKLTAVIALAALVMATTSVTEATAAPQRVTVIYAPHPDDETLRLTGYISFAAARGDKLILVAATDGGGTGLVRSWGWSAESMMAHRSIEQEMAWKRLTNGKGQVIRLNLTDGNVPAQAAAITAKANELEKMYAGNIEHYVAARDNDAHADHRAVVQAVRDSNATIVRVSQEPGIRSGTKYIPSDKSDAIFAYNSYRTIGWPSVPTLFRNLQYQNYESYITH